MIRAGVAVDFCGAAHFRHADDCGVGPGGTHLLSEVIQGGIEVGKFVRENGRLADMRVPSVGIEYGYARAARFAHDAGCGTKRHTDGTDPLVIRLCCLCGARESKTIYCKTALQQGGQLRVSFLIEVQQGIIQDVREMWIIRP